MTLILTRLITLNLAASIYLGAAFLYPYSHFLEIRKYLISPYFQNLEIWPEENFLKSFRGFELDPAYVGERQLKIKISSIMCNQTENKANYQADVDPVKSYQEKCKVNYDFYNRVIDTKGNRKEIYSDMILPHTGNAFPLKKGQVIRFEQRPSLHNGRTQILDVQFVTPDLSQWSDHLNNGPIEGLNLKLFSGVWTQSKFMEKIATVVADEFPYELLDNKDTAHMFFAAHCCPEWIEMTHGAEANVNSCHENFIHGFSRIPAIQAIEDPEERKRIVQFFADKNDINIFQGNRFGQDENGMTRCFLSPSPAVPDGTGVEFYAEKDCYVVVSNCPYADQALPFPEADPNPVYITVEDTGIAPYSNNHLNINHGWENKIYDRIFSKDVSAKPMI